MASLTIKGIPDELLDRLRHHAEQHRRSLNSEVLHLLEQSVSPRIIDPDSFLTRVRRLQERTCLPPLTEEILAQATQEDLP